MVYGNFFRQSGRKITHEREGNNMVTYKRAVVKVTEEANDTVPKIGFWKLISLHFMYLLSLFVLIIILSLISSVFLVGDAFQMVIVVISLAVVFIDPILLKKGIPTPALLIFIIMLSPFFALYKFTMEEDFVELDRKRTAFIMKRYLFSPRECIPL
jgi:hypothetical protein